MRCFWPLLGAENAHGSKDLDQRAKADPQFGITAQAPRQMLARINVKGMKMPRFEEWGGDYEYKQ
jgi:hypothetical protein